MRLWNTSLQRDSEVSCLISNGAFSGLPVRSTVCNARGWCQGVR
jgi:hypothetical protein